MSPLCQLEMSARGLLGGVGLTVRLISHAWGADELGPLRTWTIIREQYWEIDRMEFF